MDSDSHVKYLQNGIEMTIDCVNIVCNTFDGDDLTEGIDKLRVDLRDYLTQKEDYEMKSQAIEDVKRKVEELLQKEGCEFDVDKLYEEALKKRNKSNTTDFTNHPDMKKFETQVQQFVDAGDGMEADEDDSDADLIATQCSVNTIDPITKVEMKDPVKNKKCGHQYERSAILGLIRQNAFTRCPNVGCPNKSPIIPSDLEPDHKLKVYIQRKNRK